MLATYPDWIFVNFYLGELSMDLGMALSLHEGLSLFSIKSHYQNLILAMNHPEVVQDNLDKELEANCMPF